MCAFRRYATHILVTTMVLLKGYLFATALNIPLVAWHVLKVREKAHLLDNTEIFRDLGRQRRRYEFKLAFHLGMFFVYLYQYVNAAFLFSP